jgi:chromosome segregation ATPase
MKASSQPLEGQLEKYKEQLQGLHCYLNELKTMTAKCGTAEEQFKEDLIEAENNIKFYEGKIAGLKSEMDGSVKAGHSHTGKDTILPRTTKQGIGSVIFSSISFVVGALLGSKLKSRKDSRDKPDDKG